MKELKELFDKLKDEKDITKRNELLFKIEIKKSQINSQLLVSAMQKIYKTVNV